MFPRQPGWGSIVSAGCWRSRHQHLEGQLSERTRRYDQQVPVADQFLYLAEQGLVEGMSASLIEGQCLHLDVAVNIALRFSLELIAAACCRGFVVPLRLVEAASKGGHFALQAFSTNIRAHPAHLILSDDPDEGLLWRRLPFGSVEEQDQGLV